MARVDALDNGVARLPTLGYNTWNAYQCNINESIVLETAQLMQELGLQDAGYNFVNIDDCYAMKNRSADGLIIEDPDKFSGGMRNLTDQIHDLGFKAGIYSDAGWFTCGGYPGSWSNEEKDLKTFIDWGFDYLKYDNCAIPYDELTRTGIVGRYQRMADAVAKLGTTNGDPVILSLCAWGWNQVWIWGKQFGQSWRTTGDISPQWNSLASIINFNSFLTQATDFYGRNDLDMLQLGNGNLTYEESKTHFTAWALLKSPLFIGTDLSKITEETLSILKNEEIIKINQDPVEGASVSPFRWGINPDYVSNSTHPAQYWSGPTSEPDGQGGVVFMLINTLDVPDTLSFNLTESPWIRAGRQYAVHDLWTHTNNGTAVRNITVADVRPHGVVALLLQDDGNEPEDLYPQCSVWWQCTDQNGTRVGG
ncbi:glycoside hydrolase family 27 protein [Cylindrobasidium torrendii FP15055 ss-10]|uniref:Alpha-galactosidase n=1 Tax=Cylindrobasidium torrendii FP15055 ss-10 TaxID=1314674 RepID=A0A0D7BRR2_9AGAR|nr:glycoside hydrolase family 27 protein [Cylindrobasidium torrendii FP15055 ss-10]